MNARRRFGRRRAVNAIASAARLPQPLHLAEALEPRILLAIGPIGEQLQVATAYPYLPQLSAATLDADADGDFVVVWNSYGQDGSASGVNARRYAASGQPLGDAFRVNTTTAGSQRSPSVAMDSDGNFVVAWESHGQDGSLGGVYAQRYGASGEPLGGEFRVNTTTSSSQLDPSLAMDDEGNFVVVWESHGQDGWGTGIYAQRYAASGKPLGGEFGVNTTTTWHQSDPSAAMDHEGNLVVSWVSDVSDMFGRLWLSDIHAQRYGVSGERLGGEFRVNTSTQKRHRQPAVALGGDGSFVVAWHDLGDGVYARQYGAAGEPLAGPIFIAYSSYDDDEANSAVAVDKQGDFLVTWRTQAWYYGRDGDLLSTCRINTTDSGFVAGAAVAAGGDGEFVVAWAGQWFGNAARADIHAQRLRPYSNPASVGDLVWHDVNGNGMQDAGEPGVDGMWVQLFTEFGYLQERVVTSGGGFYRFNSLRPDGRYYLTFQLQPPFGYVFTHPDQGDDDSADSDVHPDIRRTPLFSLAPDEVDLNWDAGLVTPASISGVKFNDRDRDGIRDAGEEPLYGWTIYLDADADGQLDPGEMFTATDWSGRYGFGGLPPGEYRVAEVGKHRWKSTAPAGGFHSVTLSPGEDATGVDFAAYTRVDDSSAAPIGPQFRVNRTTPGDQQAPAVAMHGNGDFVLAWESFAQDGSGWDVWAQRYDRRGHPRGNEFRVNLAIAGDQRDPAIAMDAKGNFLVIWEGGGPDGAGVYARRFHHDGTARGGEFLVAGGSGAERAFAPAIAMEGDGDFVVAWEWGGIWARRYEAHGSPVGAAFQLAQEVPPQPLSSFTYSEVYGASVAISAGGDFVVAWSETVYYVDFYTGGFERGNVMARRYSAAGAAQGDAFAVGGSSGTVGAPSVAMDADGDFVVAWSAHWSYGGYPYGYPYNPTVFDTLSVRRYSAGGLAQGDASFVAHGVNPAVAIDADGDFIIAYREGSDGGRPGYDPPPLGEIRVRRSSAAGQWGDWRVNTTTAGDQHLPAVAMDRDGDFVVAWQSFGQAGDGNGIYAQRYESIRAPHTGLQTLQETAERQVLHSVLGLLDDATSEFMDRPGLGDAPANEDDVRGLARLFRTED